MVYYCFYLFIVCSFYEFLVFFVEECLIGVYKICSGIGVGLGINIY